MAGIFGGNQPYIPGLTDFRVAEADAQQRGVHGMNQALGILRLKEAQEEMEMRPLKKALLQAQVDEAKRLAGILNIYNQQPSQAASAPAPTAFGEGGISLPGGGQANLNTGQVQQPQPVAAPGQLPPHIAAGLLHPKLSPLAKVQAEAYKPTDKQRDATALGYAPGSPEYQSFVGTQYNQGGAWIPRQGGGVTLAPGYAEGRGSIERAEQGARADFDLVTVPPTGPNQPPTFRSRGDLIRGATPVPQAQPPQAIPGGQPGNLNTPIPAATQAERDRVAQRIVSAETQGGAGMVPTGSVVTPNAAGMSPAAKSAQEATAAAATKTATERAESGVKFEDAVLEGGRKARSTLTNLQILAPTLDKLPTGPLYPLMVNAGAYFSQFGIDTGQLGKDLGPAQAAQAVLNQFALKLRDPAGGGGMPGALSDQDRQFLVNMLPGLSKNPEGNRILVDVMMRIEQRKIDESDIVSKMQAAGKSSNEIREALTQFANSRPIAADLQRRMK